MKWKIKNQHKRTKQINLSNYLYLYNAIILQPGVSLLQNRQWPKSRNRKNEISQGSGVRGDLGH